MNNRALLTACAIAALVLAAAPASAVCTRDNDGKMYPWSVKTNSWQEEEMFSAGVVGWYLPIGPTGIRAMIPSDQPCYFKVMYVFKGTPAYGKVKAGDIIVGANGVVMNKPHNFGRGNGTSYEGPLTEMAPLIEHSQGADGKLELLVLRGGKKPMEKVEVKIPVVGKFSPTFPYDCERSAKLVTFLCKYLENEYKNRGGFKRGSHTNWHCWLALMASGERQYDSMLKNAASSFNGRTTNAMGGGLQSWARGYEGVFLGEYYLRYRDRSVIPYTQELCKYYTDAIGYERGGYSHNPRPGIIKRVGEGGGYGYGAMAAPAGLSMLAMSLFRAGGIPYAEFTYERIHQAYLLHTQSDRVSVNYGFKGWPSVHVELENPQEALSGRGAGYRVPDGMKNITKYKIIGHSLWCLGDDNNAGWLREMRKDTSWIEAERARNIVVEWNGKRRHIMRAPTLPEPTKPYNTTSPCAQAPVGLGAVAHLIGNSDRPSWQYLGVHAGNSCALGYKKWFDGHAAGSLHQLWVALGAARAEPAKFRQFMDGVKWWFIMQQTHDGSYMVCPNRDRPTGCNGDPHYGPHNLATANAALILSVARKTLQITGAEGPDSAGYYSGSGGSKKTEKKTVIKAPPRPPEATPEGIAKFDERLMPRVKEVVRTGKRLQFSYAASSAMQTKVRVTAMSDDGTLSLRGIRMPITMTTKLRKLTLKNKATLALAVLRKSNAADHENAAFYMKATGRDSDAQVLLLSAGDPAVVLSGFSSEPAEK